MSDPEFSATSLLLNVLFSSEPLEARGRGRAFVAAAINAESTRIPLGFGAVIMRAFSRTPDAIASG